MSNVRRAETRAITKDAVDATGALATIALNVPNWFD